MKRIQNIFGRAALVTLALSVALSLGAALVLSVSPGLLHSAVAAVQNYPSGVQVAAMPIQMAGAYATSGAIPVRFKLPYAGRLIGFSAAARTVSGVVSVDLLAGGVSLLSNAVALTAATVTDGTVTTSAVADEAELTVLIGVTGGSDTASDITILPTFLRR